MANPDLPFLDYGLWFLAAQSAPLIHILASRRIDACRKTGYSMLYFMVVCMAWILALVVPQVFGAPPLVGVLILLSPLLLWRYPFALGAEVEDQYRSSCSVNNGRCPPGHAQKKGAGHQTRP